MRPLPSRSATRRGCLTAVTLVSALTLSACSSGSDDPSGSATPASGSAEGSPSGSATVLESPAASSTVAVPQGTELTDQGSGLAFNAPATVIYEPRRNRGSVLRLTVRSVQRGRLQDFKGFLLDDAYKRKAAYYYATVSVRNVGRGDVGGGPVPLWGVNAANTLLPAVSFTTRFPPCPTRTLPARFPPGASISTCLVYLSPNRGPLTSISYRPTQQFDPITWTGRVAPAATKQAAEKPGTKKPGTKKPGTKKPGTAKSGARKPGTKKPGAKKPGAASRKKPAARG